MIRPVNVIVIMNESLSDLSVLPGVESNTDAMPFLRSLTENTIKGYAYASGFGVTTSNAEYEFLTGNTTAFLPAGTVPYQMYVSSGDPALVGPGLPHRGRPPLPLLRLEPSLGLPGFRL